MTHINFMERSLLIEETLMVEKLTIGDFVKIKDKFRKSIMKAYHMSAETVKGLFKIVLRDIGIFTLKPEKGGKETYKIATDQLAPARFKNYMQGMK